MSTTRLPELPKANGFRPDSGYTLEQMHAYGLAVWKAAIQSAVEVAKAHAALAGNASNDFAEGYNSAANRIADTLTALPDPSATPQDQGGER